jgi:hypothetical protein
LDGSNKQFEIHPKRPVVNVIEIHLNPTLERNAVPAPNLPNAGDPGPHRKTAPLPPIVLDHFGGKRGTRPHKTHIALEDIEELGQFVKTELSQKPPNWGDSGIFLNLKDRPILLILLG